MNSIFLYCLVLAASASEAECQKLLIRGSSTRYCEKASLVVDKTIQLTQSYNEGFSFFVHTEISKNLKISAMITAPRFSTFSLTGNLIIEHCSIEINSTTSSSVIGSFSTLQMQVFDSSFVSNFTTQESLDAATLSLNSTSVSIQRTKIISLMKNVFGSLSGITGNCPIVSLTKVSADFQLTTTSTDNSSCGAITANMNNAIISISLSNISGTVNAAMKNGLFIGNGNNVSIDVSVDSQVTITGQYPDLRDVTACSGLCGASAQATIRPINPVTTSQNNGFVSSFIFTNSSIAQGSQIDFDPNLKLSFNGNFSIFANVQSISNMKITGSYQVSGNEYSYGSIIGNNITQNQVEFNKIVISVSVSVIQACKLNIISNNIITKLTINSFIITGTYSTVSGSFSLMQSLGSNIYESSISSIIQNYQFLGQVTTTATVSFLSWLVKCNLELYNSNFSISSTLITTVQAGLLIRTVANQQIKLIFDSIQLKQSYSETDLPILNGVIFNTLSCQSVTINKFILSYSTQNINDIDSPKPHTVFGNIAAPIITITNSKISHFIKAVLIQRLGLISLNMPDKPCSLNINNIKHSIHCQSSGQVRDFGLVGGAQTGINYQLTSVTIKNSVLQARIIVPTTDEGKLYIGIIAGNATMSITVLNTRIQDSVISAPESASVGLIGAQFSGPLNLTNIDIQNCQISALSNSGLIASLVGVSIFNKMRVDYFAANIRSQNVQSALFCGNVTNSNLTVLFVSFKNSNLIGSAFETSSGVVFGSFVSSNATVQNCSFKAQLGEQIHYSFLNTITSDRVVSYVDIQNTTVTTSNNCFAYSDIKNYMCAENWNLQVNTEAKRYQ
ncbi:Hypothetical_protein [Hexamita inflata]|uniref:Hypothetical_protein n=1 Tax=Hexamita inflata TaxID=28002 RepID=A0AA86TV50_9EUKA|nr:Hypothetical protein HINF_LOCUS17700 [Hexamita inflata]